MKTYRVVWEIDIEANNPQEAALKALQMQRDKESTATCFDVRARNGRTVAIDLHETIFGMVF